MFSSKTRYPNSDQVKQVWYHQTDSEKLILQLFEWKRNDSCIEYHTVRERVLFPEDICQYFLFWRLGTPGTRLSKKYCIQKMSFERNFRDSKILKEKTFKMSNTLTSLIKGDARLLIFRKSSTLDTLIRVSPFINF